MLRTETLANGITVCVDDMCTFGVDAVLLSDFTPLTGTNRVCDLGTGSGIIPLLWHANGTAPFWVDAVDCATSAIALAQASVEQNGLTDRIHLHLADWRALTLPPHSYDTVVCNPPYFAPGSGKVSRDPDRRLARHEQPDTLPSLLCAAKQLLKDGGHFCFCHRPERLADVLALMSEHGFAPARIQWVYTRTDTPPFLWLCDAVLGRTPQLQVLPPHILEK